MERFAFQYFEKKGKWRYKKLREPKIWKFRQKVLRQERPLEGYVFVAVDETGEDVMSHEIYLSSKQWKTGKKEAWRPKCADRRLG